jgi:hypothetical protein
VVYVTTTVDQIILYGVVGLLMNHAWTGKHVEGIGHGLLQVIIQISLGRTEESHETSVKMPVPRPGFKPGTSRRLISRLLNGY